MQAALRFPPPCSVEELDACCRDGQPPGIQMRSSTFSFEGARVVSIIVLIAANAV
jgi:hypothetical protein